MQSIECLFIGYPDESKGFKLLDIKTKHIIIEMSVKFNMVECRPALVKEKNAEFPSYSTEYLDDEIGGDELDFNPLIFYISVVAAATIPKFLEILDPPFLFCFPHSATCRII